MYSVTLVLHPKTDTLVVPKVEKIVYSTCSVHAIENEHVVRDALNSDEATAGFFGLAHRDVVLPTWARRGLQDELGERGKFIVFKLCSSQ